MAAPLTRRSLLLASAATGLLAAAGCREGTVAPTRERPLPEVASASPRPRPRRLTPLHLTIPTIAVSSALVRLGLNEDGTVEVPTEPGSAGWFRLGTVPGQRGSSVILGHVDSVDGPAVFADLSSMRPTDRLEVALSDDTIAAFEVTGVETYPNASFPADRVYAGTRGRRELNLVTCGGDYNRERGGYQSNVVVFTRRTSA